jgi:nitrogen fixation protein FixH
MKTTSNVWPVAIILVFALFIASTISLIVMACTQKVDLVSSNYYEQELRFQGQIDRVKRTRQLATQAVVAYDSAGKRITISLPGEQAREAVTGSIQLYRPSAARLDRQIDLKVDTNGFQSVDAAGLRPGLWKVRVSWTANHQDYYTDQQVVIAPKTS